MNRLIFILSILFTTLSAIAEECYYYCGSDIITISKDSAHAVITTPKGAASKMRAVSSIEVIRHITDQTYDITVIRQTDAVNFADIKKMMPERMTETFVTPCYKDEYGKLMIPTGLIYVKLKTESDYPKLQEAAEAHGCRIVSQNKFMPLWYTLQVTVNSDGDCVDVANKIYESGLFASAEPAFAFDTCISYDPLVSEQWALYNPDYEDIDISAAEAWNYVTGKGIIVAVIDQGIELTHDDLVDNIYYKSYDAYTRTSPSGIYDTQGKEGHGTHCAGIIGAVRNNDIDIAGVAPGVRLMSVSVNLNDANSTEQIAEGINWAWKNDADIISCSLAKRNPCKLVEEAIDNAVANGREKRGCVIVCASGNDNASVSFPASYRNEIIIAVGNLKRDGEINPSSNYGEELAVCAPGTYILSTMNGNTTAFCSGTSMACPHVAGLAALILERNPSLTAKKVHEIIAKNTKKIGSIPYSTNKVYGTWNIKYGYGLIDAYKAVINTPRN